MPTQLDNRKQAIIRECAIPKTIKNLSETFEVGHQTIRREIEILESLGVIQEAPFRGGVNGREKKYVSIFNPSADKESMTYNLAYLEENFPPIWLYAWTLDSKEFLARGIDFPKYAITKMLTVYGESIGAMTDEGLPINDGYPDITVVRSKIERVIEVYSSFLELLKQILMMPNWDDPVTYGPLIHGDKKVNWDLVLDEHIKMTDVASKYWT